MTEFTADLGCNLLSMKQRDVRTDCYDPAVPGANRSVRVTHIPTGLTAHCGEHLSHRENRYAALLELQRAVDEADWRP